MGFNSHVRGVRALMIVLSAVALLSGMVFIQSCGTSGGTTDYQGLDDDGTDYRAKAQDLVDQMYAASSAEEIEPILKEIFTIIGVPVYNHENTAIVKGSGTLEDGVALRDYHLYVLADSFFKYRLNPNRHTTAKVFAAGVQNLGGENGPVSLRFEAGDTEQAFDEGMVLYLAMLYKQLSTVWGTARPYFLADLFTALAEKTPKHEYTGNFYLDPLQSFLMKLDWFSKPLNSAEYIGFTYQDALPQELVQNFLQAGPAPASVKKTKGDGMDAVKGYWSLAQYVAGSVVDTLGTVLDVGGMVAGEIIADGTEISIECDSPMYYSSGEHTITISVVFGVDLAEVVTKYGWTVGVDVPKKGPLKQAKVALEGWEALAPPHGLFSGGDLELLEGLGAGGAIANDSGDVSIKFTIKEQGETSCTEEDEEIVALVAEVNPITDPTAWQPGIVNAIWPRSMPFWINVRWNKSNSDCGAGGGGYSK